MVMTTNGKTTSTNGNSKETHGFSRETRAVPEVDVSNHTPMVDQEQSQHGTKMQNITLKSTN